MKTTKTKNNRNKNSENRRSKKSTTKKLSSASFINIDPLLPLPAIRKKNKNNNKAYIQLKKGGVKSAMIFTHCQKDTKKQKQKTLFICVNLSIIIKHAGNN